MHLNALHYADRKILEMRNILTKNTLALAIAGTFCANAWALDPQYIRLTDGITFTPTIDVSEKYDDNFRAEKNKESSWITTLAPSFQLNADTDKSAYQLQYVLSSDTFHSSHKDNNVDHHFTGDAGFEFNSRNRLVFNAGYHQIEETASADQKSINDKFNTKNIGGIYTFGADSARTQVEFAANYDELRYDNNERTTDGVRLNSDKERDASGVRSTVFYAVAPKTKVLLEGRHTNYDYKSFKVRDSKNTGLLAGVSWDSTAKTTGTFKIGREKKSFDKSVFSDKTSGMWEAGVTWDPLTYSSFNLTTRQGFDEGENKASTIKTRNTRLGWTHGWTDRISTETSYARTDKKYQDISRKDEVDNYGVSVNYQARRWLDLGLGYTFTNNSSDVKSERYKRNVYALTVSASL